MVKAEVSREEESMENMSLSSMAHEVELLVMFGLWEFCSRLEYVGRQENPLTALEQHKNCTEYDENMEMPGEYNDNDNVTITITISGTQSRQ